MKNENKKTIFEIRKELDNLPETKLFKSINRLKEAISIFQGNTNELLEHLDKMNLNAIDYMPNNVSREGRSKEINKNFRVVKRLLHNFIASVYTLIDNSRTFNKNYNKEWGKVKDFNRESQRWFENHGLSSFMYGLRKYFQHYKTPSLNLNIAFIGERNIKIVFKKKELLEFNGWSQTGKNFILKQNDSFDMYPLITAYYKYVNEFYDWFITKLNYSHKLEIDKINKKKFEYMMAVRQEIPFLLKVGISEYNNGEILKPEDIFTFLLYKEDIKEICEKNLEYIARGETFIKMVEDIFPELHDTFKTEIRRIFKEYKSKILQEEI